LDPMQQRGLPTLIQGHKRGLSIAQLQSSVYATVAEWGRCERKPGLPKGRCVNALGDDALTVLTRVPNPREVRRHRRLCANNHALSSALGGARYETNAVRAHGVGRGTLRARGGLHSQAEAQESSVKFDPAVRPEFREPVTLASKDGVLEVRLIAKQG